MKNAKENGRRAFLKKSALAAAGLGILNTLHIDSLFAGTAGMEPLISGGDGEFSLPPLGYEVGDLEPHIDAMTMMIHYGKHHQGYVTKLNAAIEKAPQLKGKSIKDLLMHINSLPEDVRMAIRNNGGGHFNHSMYWKCMSPKAMDSKMSEPLRMACEKAWGSMDSMKAEFAKAAGGVFGSGWAWIVKDDAGALKIVTTPNQDNPIMDVAMDKGKPILGIDVWEHAYYLKHQNVRGDYVSAFWDVVDWDQVSAWYGEM
ncbi:MAG: superoxide dismutase [Chitinophagales bacterium]